MPQLMEPYRIKVIEPIRQTTLEDRKKFIKEADYNLFKLRAKDILLDFLTDSGTSSMSAQQWGAMMTADESYAGAESFYKFDAAVKELMPFKYLYPVHQGRAAERILFDTVLKPGSQIPNNTHFDTTRGNIEWRQAAAVDLPIDEITRINSDHPFKGNMDIEKLDAFLKENSENVPLVVITITNNSGGGQPVSLENIKATKAVCEKYGKPLFIDACRFAENAYFIKQREENCKHKSIKEIVKEIFALADGMTMSAKKDALVNMGGWLALNDDKWAKSIENNLILGEGFSTYGGLTGRSLEAIAEGLKEVIQEDYLKHRIESVAYLGNKLSEIGVPIIKPIGGHAIFVDARTMLSHIPSLSYPGQALAVALYIQGGIRSCEIGTLMFGMQPDGTEKAANMDLVRLAIPRRAYTQGHFDYTVECFKEIMENKDQLTGYDIKWQPESLRHFTLKLEQKTA